MRLPSALAVIALTAMGTSVLVACASILGIGEPGFADIEGGPSPGEPITDAPAGVDPDAGVGGGEVGAPDAGIQRCRTSSGLCTGACLDTICSRCPPGTINLAPSGSAGAYSAGTIAYRLNDAKLSSEWLAVVPPDPGLPAEVWVGNLGLRFVRRVTVYGLRTLQGMGHDVTNLTIRSRARARPHFHRRWPRGRITT